MRPITISDPRQLIRELRSIKVDAACLDLFLAKARSRIIRFDGLSIAQTAVLKQTALICGADAAIPRDAYAAGNRRRYPALLFANEREIRKIIDRLTDQPWMRMVSDKLSQLLGPADRISLLVGRRRYQMDRTYIMGIINVTPDSFFQGSIRRTPDDIEETARRMQDEGADFLDLGAESSRPGSDPVPTHEERRRLQPVLSRLARRLRIPLSVDTCKSAIADWALDHGAAMINDITGLRFDPMMAKVVRRHGAALVIMHMRGRPKTMQVDVSYTNVMSTLHDYFQERLRHAAEAGIALERLVIDPGLGFGKRLRDNYEIINRLPELTSFNRPILAGHSRKSFIGKPFRLPPEARLSGTLAVQALLIAGGASILRVHDVREAKRAARLLDRIRS